jgi:hypothetical protein
MKRREFLKTVLGTAAVGAVAPIALAEPVVSVTSPWTTLPIFGTHLVEVSYDYWLTSAGVDEEHFRFVDYLQVSMQRQLGADAKIVMRCKKHEAQRVS